MKYLGIVDGAMGILSRKMAMQGLLPQNPPIKKHIPTRMSVRSESQASSYGTRRSKVLPIKYYNSLKPILGTKYENYVSTTKIL